MLRIRGMTLADIPTGMRLKEQAGWNQREADWRRLLELEPEGGFVALLDEVPVGTVTTCRFGDVAWVAMMLVDENVRGRGIGRALMVNALNHLDASGVRSIRLDATPLGRPLYESLGFVREETFVRYQGNLRPVERSFGPGQVPVQDLEVLDDAIALDRRVTATDRRRLLLRLAEEHPGASRVVAGSEGIAGFLMSRPGARARQIGPCIADANAGALLFHDAALRHAGEPVYIDIPAANPTAAAHAASLGLSPGRLLARMGRGPRVVERFEFLWSSAGPEKG